LHFEQPFDRATKDVLMPSHAATLRTLLAADGCTLVPSCFDALSAKMIAGAGVPFTFMTGFGVSASRLGEPDLGLISYGEIVDSVRNICAAAPIPVIADGDTGYGNALNVERTVKGYAQAGAAAVMIEDQVAPKRCGHTKGKLVVDRAEAVDRIKAANHARNAVRQSGGDILILARTDARATDGLDEAIWRANAFRDAGADILFIEAPQTEAEMRRATREAPGIHMANMVEGGATPIPSKAQLTELGYDFAIFPLTLMAAAMAAMQACLKDFNAGHHPKQPLMDFATLRRTIGFDAYYEAEKRYSGARQAPGQ
jgi:2-methylisocitrate lyase-like PEP mutase family enzyme